MEEVQRFRHQRSSEGKKKKGKERRKKRKVKGKGKEDGICGEWEEGFSSFL